MPRKKKTTLDQELLEGEVLRSTDAGEDATPLVPAGIYPTTLYLLPLSERPFFPAQSLPLLMNEGPWLETVKKIGETPQQMAGIILVNLPHTEGATPEDFYSIGTLVRMHHPVRAEGKIQFIAEGQSRFRIVKWLSSKPPYVVQVEYPSEIARNEDELKAYAMAIINTIKELMPLNPLYSEELKFFLNRFSPNEPSLLADFAASLTTASKEELQSVMDAFNLRRRMEKVLVLIKKELEVAKLQSQIREQVEQKMTKQQREFFLREQLKEIQKELGLAKDDKTADVERFRERLAKLKLSDSAKKRVDEEMQKLSVLESGSPEYAVTRNYLDWLSQLPWGKFSKDKLDLARARKILDHDHDGLDDVKERIVEFLAVGSLKGEIAGSIILLVGPPGVGKTSIGRSIANALGRKFYRFSLGGMRDEAEIKGHRRTYIGAMPGKFVQAIKECGVTNPVIMLDEIDKIGASYQGDPASALLEVLDPEQNVDFLDHYLDVRFDLSKVLFICTANQLDTIPAPLLDRMETIRLSGYITAEKVKIAKHHLWPKQLKKAGLKRGDLTITEAALKRVIEGFAREAGVRNLEKQLGSMVRKAVVKIVGGEEQPIRLGVDEVEEYLGKPVFIPEKPITGIGVVTGLAWTAMGGATLSIEATLVHTKNRGFKMTGKLGEVMRESAEIAYSYISSHLKVFKGNPAFFDEAFVHLHVPEGATPKDGPSAGVTMATALLSLARHEKISRPLAMTGELTLTGEVLAIGGLREKVIAARRIRITELIFPEANRRDFDELPDHIKEGVTAHFVRQFKDVVKIVFG
ncbi:PIM1 peptidase [Sulfuricella denitrificans skB26]|uniref:Lon protease n=1 Tax=Sulfuricella denitrificans (strain DSM 22764 / NBRC 105220 / skB26) TaxID=1163617 RepID=S6B3U1_SULDS|nr:endopeptidase La [Sulfuricella denitrificans]BAN35302.1 PIM1 peptidase [Sulfuricella denitrificans skB26]